MPDLLLEQKAMGELPPGMEGDLERLLAEDDTVPERLASIEQSNRDFLEEYPAGPMVARIKRRAAPTAKQPRPWGLWLGLPALATAAAAALVLLVLVPALQGPGPGPLGIFGATHGPEILRIKGDPRLKIYRKGDSKVLLPEAVVVEGEGLMVHYVAGGAAKYGVILSVDGRGSVSLHFPALPDGSTRLVVGGDQELRHSFELDDAPHFERFFFLTSTSPMDVKAAKRAINALGDKADKVRPRLPAGVVLQYELLLRKGRPRTGTP